MNNVPRVAEAMQRVLEWKAEEIGRQSGFIKRERKLNGSSFVKALVMGWLSNGEASISELSQTAAAAGVQISEQGLAKRFTPEAAECMKQVLEAAMEEVIAAEPVAIELLRRFTGVHLLDSSTIGLPRALATIWSGCGGSQGESAALKIQVDINIATGALHSMWLQAGREHDHSQQAQAIKLPAGTLQINDLGYFKLEKLHKNAQQGTFWLTRLKIGTNIYQRNQQQIELGKWLTRQTQDCIDLPIYLGHKHRIACRLLAVRVPDRVAAQRRRKLKRDARRKGQTVSQSRLALAEWTLLVTNVSSDQLTLQEAVTLYRVRWQIELLFKLWKSVGQLASSRSQNPWRILCEIYAKLLAMIIQHWIFLISFWQHPDRSLTKAARTVQKFALPLALVTHSIPRLREVISVIDHCLAAGCRINSRRARPNTYQLLLDP